MSEDVPQESASALGRVDEVCRRFEAAWKAHLADRAGAPRPRLEDYADALPEADRPLLARELRAVDAVYARRLEAETVPPTAPLVEKDGPGDDGVSRVHYLRPSLAAPSNSCLKPTVVSCNCCRRYWRL
jgi:hypothetical protein